MTPGPVRAARGRLAPTCRNAARQAAQEGSGGKIDPFSRSGVIWHLRPARTEDTQAAPSDTDTFPRIRLSTHAEVRAAVLELIEGRQHATASFSIGPPLWTVPGLWTPAGAHESVGSGVARGHTVHRGRFSTSNREFLHFFSGAERDSARQNASENVTRVRAPVSYRATGSM